MRIMMMAAAIGALGAVTLPATAAEAQWRGGYGQGYGRNDVRRELRECQRELRRADSRREYRRELRECQREIRDARRDGRYDRYDRRGRYWDGYRWRYRRY